MYTHTKYPELSLLNYIPIAISKSYKTTDKKTPKKQQQQKPTTTKRKTTKTHQLYLYTTLGPGDGEENKATINTTSFALYPPYLSWQPGHNIEWWTPETASRHLNYSQ